MYPKFELEMLAQESAPVVGGAAVAQRPVAGEVTDGLLLLEADDDEGTGQGLGQPGALQNVKRWMKQLHFPDQVCPEAGIP